MIAPLLLAAAAQPKWALTPDGLGPVKIGMTREDVSRVLRAKLRGQVTDKRGIAFETGEDRRVYSIGAGEKSITYAEGCA